MEKIWRVLSVLPLEQRHREYLQQAAGGKAACTFRWKSYASVTPEDVAWADVILGNVPPALVAEYAGAGAEKSHLCWMQLNSAGADAYAGPEVLRPETILTCSKGAYGVSVSEHMMTMTFCLIRRMDQYLRQQVRHEWKTAGAVTSLQGSVVLVLGLGDIGGRYARMCHALGARVIGVRRSVRGERPDWLEEEHTMEDLDELLPRADIVAMILPGGPATEYVMDERRLRLMKPGAYLINDGRGNAIDPAALKKVLREGHLGGAALDVTEPEPLPADDALWDMDRVIITPHIAGQFLLAETFENVVRIAGENLRAFVSGAPLQHVVDRKAGY